MRGSQLQAFWRQVREVAEGLPRAVFITSIEDESNGITGGAICEATARLAAQRIVEGSHRRSTPEEIEGWQVDQRQRRGAAVTDELRRSGVIRLSPHDAPEAPLEAA